MKLDDKVGGVTLLGRTEDEPEPEAAEQTVPKIKVIRSQ